MTIAVHRTLTDVRSRIRGELGSVGIPAPHWPRKDGEDCLGLLTWAAGIRDADNFSTSLISIAAFRATAGWHTIRGAADLRPGDWPLWDWDLDGDVDHIGFAYSLDRTHNELTTDEADTSPKPGVPMTAANRGVYEKTRPLNSPELWGALRPPYAAEPVTSSDKSHVRKAGTYLNQTMPSAFHDAARDRVVTLYRTGAGDIGKAKGDGIRGPIYRLLVQCWGRKTGLYGDTYKLDGIFGPRSEYVEDHLFAAHG